MEKLVINYKFYLRKSSFKNDLKNANALLKIISENKPVNFLEIGVLEGATSRNICEVLYLINGNKFNYIGIDIFNKKNFIENKNEFTPISKKINNPLKWFLFRLILKMDPHSKESVEFLLRKFKDSINIYEGLSKNILGQIDLKKIDFVFLDGGHSYKTVKDDLNILTNNLKKNSLIICDDYNVPEYGVKKAVDEMIKENYFKDLGRFALIKIKK